MNTAPSKRDNILAMITAANGQSVHISAIAMRIYGDDMPPAHAASIRSAIAKIRRTLVGSGKTIVQVRNLVWLADSDQSIGLPGRWKRGRGFVPSSIGRRVVERVEARRLAVPSDFRLTMPPRGTGNRFAPGCQPRAGR